MNLLFEIVLSRLAERQVERDRVVSLPPGRGGRCHCQSPIFFNNSVCLACRAPLGYIPSLMRIRSFVPGAVMGEWWLGAAAAGDRGAEAMAWRRCANFESPAGCNWMVAMDDPAIFCVACRLNRTIPDLSFPENAVRWHKIEVAKRRLMAQLLEFGLPVRAKSDDPQRGLAFDFVATLPGQLGVMTSHADGLITLNIEEADDVVREQIRSAFDEPHRTLLGHLRHEVAHHYWEQLVAGTGWHEPFRAVFGDERADYAAALQQHYFKSPPPDWPLRHVSAYAAAHPWEDWAETWAYYLQISDTLATAVGFGLGASDVDFETAPFTRDALYAPEHSEADAFLAIMNAWVELTAVLNELSRSLGLRDVCPSVLSAAAVRKLHFVHLVITGG